MAAPNKVAKRKKTAIGAGHHPADADGSADLPAVVGSISNDFNNLLSIILGYTALLQEQEGGVDEARARLVAEGIEGAVRRASALVRQTLYLGQRAEPVLQASDLNAFVETCIQHRRSVNGERPYRVDFSVQRDLQTVPFDPQQFGDAIDEMLVRLGRVDPAGARAITVRTAVLSPEEVAVDWPDAVARPHAFLELRHDGIHTASSFPAGGQGRDDGVGHDLGLTVVRRIVQAHRGQFFTEGLSRGGRVFRLALPLGLNPEIESTLRSTTVSSAPIPVDGQPVVLVIDDERGLLETLACAIRRLGCEVHTASDGIEGLERFKQHADRLNLVLCDLGLPRLSGWDVFTAIRSIRPGLPVLVMSGHVESKLNAAVNRSGAAGFLQKPFSVATAMQQVRQVLGAGVDGTA